MPLPFDLTVAAYSPYHERCVLFGLRDACRVGSRRGHVAVARWHSPQRIVGSLHVVVVLEPIKASLLSAQTVSRSIDVGFERAMHPLVARVLFGMARADALQPNAQLEPPDRQARQPTQRYRSERGAVVAADRLGQAVLAKAALHVRPYRLLTGMEQPLAQQQITTAVVRQGQGITPAVVAQAKVSLEVHAPQGIGRARVAQYAALHGPRCSAFTRLDQPVALEQLAHSAARWQAFSLPFHAQPIEHLTRTELGIAPLHLQQLRDHARLHRVAMMVRRTRARLKTSGTFVLIARQQNVAALARDAKSSTRFGKTVDITLHQRNELDLLIHGTGLLPRHRRVLLACTLDLLPMCPDNSVTNVPGLYPPLPSPARGEGERRRVCMRCARPRARGDTDLLVTTEKRTDLPHDEFMILCLRQTRYGDGSDHTHV